MCGIVGYTGVKDATEIVIDGLKRLEYRGYDSAGLSFVDSGLPVVRVKGKVRDLEVALRARRQPPGKEDESVRLASPTTGIGHTRWATHGAPSEQNAHPLQGCDDRFSVVHNGIIENHQQLKDELVRGGHRFHSETDTEVVAHLLEEHYRGDLLEAMLEVVNLLRGAFALVVMARDEPGRIVTARQGSPLVIGLGNGENFVASDIPAILPYTRETYILDDGELADVSASSVRVFSASGNAVDKNVFNVTWDPVQAQKGGYPHFMLKEIHEQPQAVRDTLSGRIIPSARSSAASELASELSVAFDGLQLPLEDLADLRQVYFVACGTAYYASLVAADIFQRLTRVPAHAAIASEFRNGSPILGKNTLVILVSQSGETLDTLTAMRKAKAEGSFTLAISNVVGSTIAREADAVIYTWAGPEIAVASTKAYTTQLVLTTLLSAFFTQEMSSGGRESLYGEKDRQVLLQDLQQLPERAKAALETEVGPWAQILTEHEHVFYLGRGLDYFAALEGQHKLKEISYIHAEAYPAGELKHGALALITEGTPVVVVATQPEVMEKTVNNIQEIKARGAYVLAVTQQGQPGAPLVEGLADTVISIPETHPLLAPVLAAIPLQLLAYETAVLRGTDVDQPRNLAKSVTVE